jgi:type IV fimbrial biogenesis protein FimT
MRIPFHIQGVTLIELMIVILITAVLLAIGIPAFQSVIDRNRLKSATENLFADLQFAKAESVKRNAQVFIIVSATSGNSNWNYYLTENSACTSFNDSDKRSTVFCGTGDLTNGRVRREVTNSDFPGVTISPSSAGQLSFSPIRGLANGGNGTVILNSRRGKELRVIVSSLGRIRTCSPSGSANVPGYLTPCP